MPGMPGPPRPQRPPGKRIAVLVGGPDGTHPWPDGSQEPLKLLRGNGYERFEFTEEYVQINGEQVPVYCWSYRTSIAE